MTVTEAEAITKWCPLARGQNWDDRRSEDGSFTANRLQSGDPIAACLCIGARCMAWRWDGRMNIDAVKAIREARGLSIHEAIHEYRAAFTEESTGTGYCGAFGKP